MKINCPPWNCVLALSLWLTAPAAVAFTADTPVTPGASPEAQSLLAFFSDTYGKHIISGQQDGWQRSGGLTRELSYITNTTGHLPAILAQDLSGYTDKSGRHETNHFAAQRGIAWYRERNGIPEFCCHWRAPMNAPGFYSKETTFDIRLAVLEGTPEHAAMLRDLDAIAAELAILRDAHVPVLWRPLHEANGRWFWWGAGGPEPFRALWRTMFEVFTVKHHLNNLIWVFSPGAETDLADWYPGDAYVDIVGQDHYPMDGNHGPAKDVFDELTTLTRGTKLLALGENGPVPDIQLVRREHAGWLFFTTWSGSILFEKTTPEQLREAYNDPYVLNLGDLPDLRHYPYKPAGPAVKIGFPAPPGDVALGGTRHSPVTVTWQDRHGKTVRTATGSITLALKGAAGASLTGTLTAAPENGVATFADASLAGPFGKYRFNAITASGAKAASTSFLAGPGNGALREVWLGKADFSGPPDATEILARALETPVCPGTNYLAHIRGLIIPPQSGPYRFWVASGGPAELWLQTGSSPSSRQPIAAVTRDTPYQKWPHTSVAASAAVKLSAGKHYAFEILQKQAQGSTQLNVWWELPDGTQERPIPAFRLAQPNPSP